MNRIVTPLMGMLGAALPLLIDSAAKGAAILLLAGLLTLALRKASAAARHLVWSLALGALLALPLLSAMLPGWRVLPSWTLFPPPGPSSPWTAIVSPPTETENLKPAVSFAEFADIPGRVRPAESPSAPAKISSVIRPWLPIAWIAGFTLLMLRLLGARFLLSRAVRRCEVVTDGRVWEVMKSARRELHITRPVRVLLDPGRAIPMVWGLLRPSMMLPAEAVEWSDSQRRSVILHELAHIKRRDLAAQCLMQITCALHWFNPLVWVAAWRLHVEAEHACDNLVLSSGVRASDYAEHVLHVATKLVPSCGSGAVSLAMARPSRLEGRMIAVLSNKLNRRGVTRALALTGLVFGLFVIIPMAMLRAADEKKPTTAESSPAPADGSGGGQKRLGADAAAEAVPAGESVIIEVAADGSLSVNGKAVTLKSLSNELASLSGGRPIGHIDVHIATGTYYNRVVEVFDELEKSGAGGVTIRTPAKKGVSRLPMVREADRSDEIREKRQTRPAEGNRYKDKREADSLRAEVEDSQADIARLKLRQAEAQVKRLEQLSAEHLVSNQEVEKARMEVARWKAESLQDSKEKLKAEVELAEAELALNEANFKRMAELFDKKLVAQSEIEMAKAEMAIAQAKLRAAKAKLNSDAGNTNARTWPASNPAKKERLLQILDDEIKVAAAQAKLVHEQRNQGRASIESVFRADFDVMALQRERAAMKGDPATVKDLVTQQIGVLQELEKATREQRREGVESESEVLKVRRQILMLQRQQAEME